MASRVLVDEATLPALCRQMEGWKGAALDVETTTKEPYLGGKLLGVGLADINGDDYYFVPHQHPEHPNPLPNIDRLWTALDGMPLVNHKVKFDLHALAELGGMPVKMPPRLFDIHVGARIAATEEHPNLELQALGRKNLGYEYESGLKDKRGSLEKEPLKDVASYCCEDVYVAQKNYHFYKRKLAETPTLANLWVWEGKISQSLWRMERQGWQFDPDYLHYLAPRLEELTEVVKADIRLRAGKDFNPNSNKQVSEYMNSIGVFSPVRSQKTKEQSWGKEVLFEVGRDHPEAMRIAQYRSLTHTRSGIVSKVEEYDRAGRTSVHGSYNNGGTVTGRLSSSDPNHQNHTNGWLQLGEVGDEEPLKWAEGPVREVSIRRLFVPRRGRILVSADYRQLEMFILGYFMQDPFFFELLKSEDIHGAATTEIFGVPEGSPEFDAIRKRRTKVILFGIIYGMGLESQAKTMGSTEDEAAEFHNTFFGKIQGFQPFKYRVRKAMRQNGYCANFYGRRYVLPEERSYVMINRLVQGTAGDFAKSKMPETLDFWDREGLEDVLFGQTHDELIMDLPEDALGLLPRLREMLEDSPFGMRLPVSLSVSGKSLAELEKYVA